MNRDVRHVHVHQQRYTAKTWILSAAPWRTPRVRHTIVSVKRDLCTWKETYVHESLRTFTNIERGPQHKHVYSLPHPGVTRGCAIQLSLSKETMARSAIQLSLSKETYVQEKRRMYTNSDLRLWTSKEAHSKNVYMLCRTLAYLEGAPYNCLCQKRPMYMKRDHVHEERPTYMKRDLRTWSETYVHEERPTYMKRDLCTYVSVKRDLCTWRESSLYSCTWK